MTTADAGANTRSWVSTSAAAASRPRSSTSAPAGDRADPGRDAAARDARRGGGRRSPASSRKFARHGPIGCTLPARRGERRRAHRGAHRPSVDRRARGDACRRGRPIGRASCSTTPTRRASPRRASARRARRRGVVVMVTVGTGVGTAVLNDGVLVPNSELGHIFVERPPRRHVGVRRDAHGEDALVEAVDAPPRPLPHAAPRDPVARAHRDRRRHRQARRQVPRSRRPRLRGADRGARQSRGHRRRRARGRRARTRGHADRS